MKNPTRKRLTSFFTFALSIFAYSQLSHAQYLGPGTSTVEPARWTQEDLTPEQKLSTAKTEAVNAQQQFMDECKRLATSLRAACIAETKKSYQIDMADIHKRFGVN